MLMLPFILLDEKLGKFIIKIISCQKDKKINEKKGFEKR